MAITASMVKELREMTGAGMMDCKKALNESNGDMDAAIEYLRKSNPNLNDFWMRSGNEAIFVDGPCSCVELTGLIINKAAPARVPARTIKNVRLF